MERCVFSSTSWAGFHRTFPAVVFILLSLQQVFGADFRITCPASGFTDGTTETLQCQVDGDALTAECAVVNKVRFELLDGGTVSLLERSDYPACDINWNGNARCVSNNNNQYVYEFKYSADQAMHGGKSLRCWSNCVSSTPGGTVSLTAEYSSCDPIRFTDPCGNNPCENGGTCVDVSVDYRDFFCLCPEGWIGLNCSKKGDCNDNGDLKVIALINETALEDLLRSFNTTNAYRDVDTTNATCACFWTHQGELCVALSGGLIALIVCLVMTVIIIGTGSGVIIYKWNNRPWAKCGDCHKWRRLTMIISDDLRQKMFICEQWTCSLNPDEKFNRCDIQQDKGIDAREVMKSLQETLEKYKKDKNISDVRPNQLIWLKCNKCKKWRKQKDNQAVLDVRQINTWTCPTSICGAKQEPGRKEDLIIRLILLAMMLYELLAKCGKCHKWRLFSVALDDDKLQNIFIQENLNEIFKKCANHGQEEFSLEKVEQKIPEILRKCRMGDIRNVTLDQTICLKDHSRDKWYKQDDEPDKAVLDAVIEGKWRWSEGAGTAVDPEGLRDVLQIRLYLQLNSAPN